MVLSHNIVYNKNYFLALYQIDIGIYQIVFWHGVRLYIGMVWDCILVLYEIVYWYCTSCMYYCIKSLYQLVTSSTVQVPITKQCIKTLSIVICVDLSKPETIWTTLESLLNTIKLRVKKVVAELKQECPR